MLCAKLGSILLLQLATSSAGYYLFFNGLLLLVFGLYKRRYNFYHL